MSVNIRQTQQTMLASVIMIPAKGPKNTVYPFMKARKPVALPYKKGSDQRW
jgi:hypothetical protein